MPNAKSGRRSAIGLALMQAEEPYSKVAVIVGVTGLIGSHLLECLLQEAAIVKSLPLRVVLRRILLRNTSMRS